MHMCTLHRVVYVLNGLNARVTIENPKNPKYLAPSGFVFAAIKYVGL